MRFAAGTAIELVGGGYGRELAAAMGADTGYTQGLEAFMKRIIRQFIVSCTLSATVLSSAAQTSGDETHDKVLLDDFEQYRAGGLPTKWQYYENRTLVPVAPRHVRENEYFQVAEENGNKYVRLVTQGEAHRIVLGNGDRFDWDLRTQPRLRWDWRAIKLPDGAREDKNETNDTGGAVYVTFSRDWLGRPRSIKYTYSSTLPVGTVTSYGVLKVLVVSTALEGTGEWLTVDRDVVADYRRIFGGDPPDRPLAIMLWSDSDTMKDAAEVHFDNLMLLPPQDK